jgi:hypothetical protein
MPCRKTEKALLNGSKEVGLEVNPEAIKYMLMTRYRKAGQTHSKKKGNDSLNVPKFKCFGRLTDKFACTKSKLNSGNGYCQSVLSPLPSRLVYRNVKVKIYKTIILTVVLYGCETWSLTLREEHRLRVFENRVLRKKFVQKREEITGQRRKFNN